VHGIRRLIAGLIILNRLRVERIAGYVLFGVALWVFALKIGVHATLVGVLIAMAVPMRSRAEPERSPLKDFEYALHPWVAYGILIVMGSITTAGIPGYFIGETAETLLIEISASVLIVKPEGWVSPMAAEQE